MEGTLDKFKDESAAEFSSSKFDLDLETFKISRSERIPHAGSYWLLL